MITFKSLETKNKTLDANLVSLHLIFFKGGDVLRICISQASYDNMNITIELSLASST